MHSLRCYWQLILAAGRSTMQHRVHFFADIFDMVISYSTQFLTLWWLTRRFPRLLGWSVAELLLLLAMSVLAWGICVTFFFTLNHFGEKVRRGDFDRCLVRPLNPFIQVIAEQSPLMAAGQLIWSLFAFLWIGQHVDIQWTLARVLYALAAGLGGALILGAACVAVGAAAFWIVRSQALYWSIVFPARQLITYPVAIYGRPLQLLLTFVLPFGFVNYYPASWLLGKVDTLFHPLLPLLSPLVGGVAFLIAYRLWWLGVSRYQSTGS